MNKFVQLGLNFRGNAFSVFPLRFMPSFSYNKLPFYIPLTPSHSFLRSKWQMTDNFGAKNRQKISKPLSISRVLTLKPLALGVFHTGHKL